MNVIEIVRQLTSEITRTDLLLCVSGLILLGIWLFRTSLGREALAYALPRRNNMPVYLPLIPLFIWLGGMPLAVAIRKVLWPQMPDWQDVLLDNVTFCVFGTATTAVIMYLATSVFARRLKGFGLNAKTIHRDFCAAIVNLLSIWPLVILALMLTMFLGRLILGPEFAIRPHEELKKIAAHPQLSLRIFIVITAVVVAPVVEEMLFRGLFQTLIRSFLGVSLDQSPPSCAAGNSPQNDSLPASTATSNGAWLAIVMSAALFAAVHYEPAHWPALFILAVGMGYSYEKSGSLFRPIFIHSLFNAAMVTVTLSQ